MFKFRQSPKRQFGVTLVEALASIGIFSAAMVGMSQMATVYSEDVTAANAADHLKMIANASQSYIKDNFATVTASATNTTPFLIRTSDLVGGGYLTPALASANGYGQSTCVLAFEPTANKINALVITEGGTTLDDLALGNVVKLAGGSAGTISSATPTLIKGASGGWQLNVSDWHNRTNQLNQRCNGTAGAVQVTAGHLVSALWFEDGAYQNPTLYRDAVPGRPELNTMNAPIIFNSTQTVGAACSTPGALSNDSAGAMVNCTAGQWKAVGGSVFWADAVATFAALPACNAAAQNSTRVVRTPAVGTTPRAYTCDGTTWQAVAVDNNGNMTLPGTLTAGKLQITDVATERTACPSNGALARNTAGATLTCQGGVWTRMLAASGDVASRDGTAQCCGDPGSLALAENSATTGRKAGLSLHNAGQTQGNMYLTSGDALGKRVVFGDTDDNTMRVEANDFYIRAIGKFASQLGGATCPVYTGDLNTLPGTGDYSCVIGSGGGFGGANANAPLPRYSPPLYSTFFKVETFVALSRNNVLQTATALTGATAGHVYSRSKFYTGGGVIDTQWKLISGMPAGYAAWTDVTSQRANNSVYTNNSGRPLVFSAWSSCSSSSGTYIYINGSLIGFGQAQWNGCGAFGYTGNVTVPPGATYQVGFSSGAVAGWWEMFEPNN